MKLENKFISLSFFIGALVLFSGIFSNHFTRKFLGECLYGQAVILIILYLFASFLSGIIRHKAAETGVSRNNLLVIYIVQTAGCGFAIYGSACLIRLVDNLSGIVFGLTMAIFLELASSLTMSSNIKEFH